MIHSFLSLKGHSVGVCRLAEAWCTAMRVGVLQEAAAAEQAAKQRQAEEESAKQAAAEHAEQPEAEEAAESAPEEKPPQQQLPPQQQPKQKLPVAPPLVSECQTADMVAVKPSELLEMVAWAAACPRG